MYKKENLTGRVIPFIWVLITDSEALNTVRNRVKTELVMRKQGRASYKTNYHFIITLPQVNPLPKAASTTVSPSLTLPC